MAADTTGHISRVWPTPYHDPDIRIFAKNELELDRAISQHFVQGLLYRAKYNDQSGKVDVIVKKYPSESASQIKACIFFIDVYRAELDL